MGNWMFGEGGLGVKKENGEDDFVDGLNYFG